MRQIEASAYKKLRHSSMRSILADYTDDGYRMEIPSQIRELNNLNKKIEDTSSEIEEEKKIREENNKRRAKMKTPEYLNPNIEG